jgi:hypothetical protein
MLFIFSTPELIRNLWQLAFLHWCIICAVPLRRAFLVAPLQIDQRSELREGANFNQEFCKFGTNAKYR